MDIQPGSPVELVLQTKRGVVVMRRGTVVGPGVNPREVSVEYSVGDTRFVHSERLDSLRIASS